MSLHRDKVSSQDEGEKGGARAKRTYKLYLQQCEYIVSKISVSLLGFFKPSSRGGMGALALFDLISLSFIGYTVSVKMPIPLSPSNQSTSDSPALVAEQIVRVLGGSSLSG